MLVPSYFWTKETVTYDVFLSPGEIPTTNLERYLDALVPVEFDGVFCNSTIQYLHITKQSLTCKAPDHLVQWPSQTTQQYYCTGTWTSLLASPFLKLVGQHFDYFSPWEIQTPTNLEKEFF